jgi:hypothetical protein
MKEAVRTLWGKTRIMAWPGDYLLVSLPLRQLQQR